MKTYIIEFTEYTETSESIVEHCGQMEIEAPNIEIAWELADEYDNIIIDHVYLA